MTELLHCRNYVSGKLFGTVAGAINAKPWNYTTAGWALLTCLNRSVNILSNCRSLFSGPYVESVGNGNVVPTISLQEDSVRERMFRSYDEVWFCRHGHQCGKILCNPHAGKLLSLHKTRNLPKDELNDLVTWMEDNDCELALSDGRELNFIFKISNASKSTCWPITLINYSAKAEGIYG